MIARYLQAEWITDTVRIIMFTNQLTGLTECFIARRYTPAHSWGPFHKAAKV